MLQSSDKINERVIECWSRILSATAHSRLFLKADQLDDPEVKADILLRFANYGITADRIRFEGHTPRRAYFESYQQVDVALDPFPYPGGTTTVEAIWMGVPVLTLAGENFLGRQGVGVLANAGLSDWIANTHDEYVQKGISFAADVEGLNTLRKNQREMVLKSPIFDAERFADHFYSALREMWKRWCKQQVASAT